MKPRDQQLHGIPLIDALPPEVRETHIKHGQFRIVPYKAHSMIHMDGEVCTKLEIIISGSIAVERIDETGHLLTVSEFTRGDILGGNLLFSKHPHYPMTISTRCESVLLEMNKDVLFELLRTHNDFLRTYLEFLSDRTFILGDKIKHYMGKTIRESILNFLLHESQQQNSKTVELRMTKKELAESLGVQRTSLSRELAKMRADGLVVYDKHSITLI